MSHQPTRMMKVDRYAATHRAVVRQKARTRRHWMAKLRCPVCGTETRMLDNACRDMICDGERPRLSPREQ